jgi:hypothetical protein
MVTTDFISTESPEKACRQLTIAFGVDSLHFFPMPMFYRHGNGFVVKLFYSESDPFWPSRA